MKRFTLLLIVTGMFTWSFGQVLQTGKDALMHQPPQKESIQMNHQKGGGDVIWSTTFGWKDEAEDRGWKLPDGWAIGEDEDMGFVWVWRDDTIHGNYTNVAPRTWFDTPEDGFIVVPIDEYNSADGQTQSNHSGTWIQTPPIDCSAVSSVVVNFYQYFRLCCSDYNLEMLVTNDGGVHWATYDVRFDVAGNTFTPVRFRDVKINISDVAAGSPSVQIRFYMHGPSHYFWMIDDLVLTEAYDYDLVLEDYWAYFDGGYDDPEGLGHINYWPLSQMGMAGETAGTVGGYTFRSAHLNQGNQDAENARLNVQILKNGTEIDNKVSDGMTIWSLDRDTQNILDPFLADDYGDYQFNLEAVMDNEDEVPDNNDVSLRFTVTDSLFHRADFSAESSANTGGWVGGNNAGDMVGVDYEIFAPCEINSITAYLTGYSAAANAQYQFVLMKDIEGEYTEWLASDVMDMDSTTNNTWVTLPLDKDGETEFLEAGDYAACVRMWGDDPNDEENGRCGLSVGWDMDTKPSHTLMYLSVGGNWYSTGKLNMIGININDHNGPAVAPVTFNVDMTNHIASGEFNPDADFVDVAGTFNDWSGSEHLTDADGDGIYTITIADLPVGQVIEYKYRINANWDTSEFPFGGPNRTYTVRYWNVLNNVYNNGETAGVDNNQIINRFSVYPNPNNGVFTVDITNALPSDIQISLMDIQGQVVYQNKVNHVMTHQEVINTELSKGVYFLSVNNGKEVKVRKVIVR
ncbi:MAG: T9SS type A sorting domain-containing protein [Bacteroidales bacterium]|nr:T9SS type A sorting domain-containing protein [Bacteroidales bacterium]